MKTGTICASANHTVDHEGKRRFHVGLQRNGVHLTAAFHADQFIRFIESLHERIDGVRRRGLCFFDFVWPSKTEFHMVTLSIDSGDELIAILEAEWFHSLWTPEVSDVQAVAV